MGNAPIVLGSDGSGSSDTALQWALTEARARHRPLRIVHVVANPGGATAAYGIYAPPDPSMLLAAGEQALALVTARVHELAPEVEVESIAVIGEPATGLLEHLGDAEMAVLGSRGNGTFAELLLGSTAFVVATHSTCPVIVVRHAADGEPVGEESGRVVIGVDGSSASFDALDFAFEEASLGGRGLTVVHAWETPFYDLPGPGGPLVDSMVVADFEGDEFRLLGETMAGWREKYPDVDVRQVVAHRDAVAALVAASVGAHLLVVGSRGRGGFKSLLLGSVGHGVLHHARCSVAVVRPTRTA